MLRTWIAKVAITAINIIISNFIVSSHLKTVFKVF
jgi:hypothetical protein